jgi:tetratricopeptide (TPR) repeat protein
MSRAAARWFVPLWMALLVAAASAQDAAARRTVEQKLELVRQLVSDSPAARRIAASGNATAQRYLDDGRRHFERAGEALRAGDIAAAGAAADEALWSFGRARQLVPDDASRTIAERVRYQQLLQSAERMVPAFREHLAHAGATDSPDLAAAVGLIENAKAHAAAERFAEANRALLQAERHLLVGLNRTIGDRTIVYRAHFETPALEFDYELERHRSVHDLVPIAIDELKPGDEARAAIRRVVERSQSLRARAVALAGERRYDVALETIREATALLHGALTAAGLAMPTQ